MQSPSCGRSLGVVSGNLNEHFAEATLLLAGEHVHECLGCALETGVLALLELVVAVCELLGNSGVEVVLVLVLCESGDEVSLR